MWKVILEREKPKTDKMFPFQAQLERDVRVKHMKPVQ